MCYTPLVHIVYNRRNGFQGKKFQKSQNSLVSITFTLTIIFYILHIDISYIGSIIIEGTDAQGQPKSTNLCGKLTQNSRKKNKKLLIDSKGGVK